MNDQCYLVEPDAPNIVYWLDSMTLVHDTNKENMNISYIPYDLLRVNRGEVMRYFIL